MHDALSRLARRLDLLLAPGARLELRAVRLAVHDGARTLGVGPGKLLVAREPSAVTLRFVPGAAASAAGAPAARASELELDARLPLDGDGATARFSGGPVSLAWLGLGRGDAGLVDPAEARLAVDATVAVSKDGREVTFDGTASLSDLGLDARWLSPEPVLGVALSATLRGSVATDGSRVRVDAAELRLGQASATLTAEFARGNDWLSGTLRMRVPRTHCQALLGAVPRGLAPDLAGFELSGTAAMDLDVRYDSRVPTATTVRLDLDNQCRIVSAPERFLPQRFLQPFEREVTVDGGVLSVVSGPGTADWWPLSEMSPYLETAVLVCEDGRFWHHSGLDPRALASALRDDLVARRFVRGGSTVTMQLAKNLYLERTKALSRKVEEAMLTMLLEERLSKEQLLELYLNVVELGPGIYGVGAAARRLFGTTPERLTLAQAFYLASILPAPTRSHFDAEGALSPGWTAVLHRLLRTAHELGRLSETELLLGLSEPVRRVGPAESPGGALDVGADASGPAQAAAPLPATP